VVWLQTHTHTLSLLSALTRWEEVKWHCSGLAQIIALGNSQKTIRDGLSVCLGLIRNTIFSSPSALAAWLLGPIALAGATESHTSRDIAVLLCGASDWPATSVRPTLPGPAST
jgi:hypothetical protein